MVGCTDAASAPASPKARPSPSLATVVTRAADDAELNLLTQGVLDLNSRIMSAGSITTSQLTEVERLATAVNTWRTRTGRTDITASLTERRATLRQNQGGAPCDQILTADPATRQFCIRIIRMHDPATGVTVCQYWCFTVPPSKT
jgi:hypothetical protein